MNSSLPEVPLYLMDRSLGLLCGQTWAELALNSFLALLVITFVLRNLDALHRILYPYFVAPWLGRADVIRRHCRPGDWAVITGSTDGIGKAYALEFARMGANIVLISRTQEKLNSVRNQFMEEVLDEIQIKTIVFDFATAGHEDYERIRAELDGLTVSALVNCVGATYEELGSLGTVPEGERMAAEFLNINCLSATLMSRLVVEGMVERGRGAIINVCSVASVFPIPFLAMYGACKAYVGHLTRAMQMEYEGSGVVLQAVYPFFVDTKMGRMRQCFQVPSPEHYARQALQTFGHQDHSFGCFSHSLMGEATYLLWSWIANLIFKNKIYGLMVRQQRRKQK